MDDPFKSTNEPPPEGVEEPPEESGPEPLHAQEARERRERHRRLREEAEAEAMKHPAYRAFYELEMAREQRMRPIRQAFIKAHKEKK